MTWPPPPPSSDPWAAEPEPQPADIPDPFAESPPDRHPEPEPETPAGAAPVPHDDGPPIVEAEPAPASAAVHRPAPPSAQLTTSDPALPIDAGYIADPTESPYEPDYRAAPPASPRLSPAPPPGPPIGPPDDGAFSSPYHEPPRVVPRPQAPPPPSKKPIWLAAAAVAALVVVGVVVWLLIPSGGDDQPAPAAPPTTSAPRTADPQVQARLLSILPPGYRAGTCTAAAPPTGARAAASCGPNADPGGPVSATYTVAENAAAVDAAFNAVVNGSTRVNCPGNIQSPGPWRRNATPDKVSGILFCGIQQNRPVVAWTNVDESLVAVVTSGPQGPNLDQLYAWWGTHS